jgi:hypothetical protein
MALGDTYATLVDLKAYLRIGDSVDDTRLNDALETASRGVEKLCRRTFNRADTPSPRVFTANDWGGVDVDDFHTTTGLVIRSADVAGVFGDPWLPADYALEPLNGIVDGEEGWPYNRLIMGGTRIFDRCNRRRGGIEVTAAWGWAAVPSPVKQSTLIVAAETFKLSDAPFGVAGFADWGMIRVRDNPMAASKLGPYRRDAALVA